MDKEKTFVKFFNLPFRLNLCYILSLKLSFENIDYINRLIFNFSDIKIILNNIESNILEFLYINRDIIHRILYDEEDIIQLFTRYINSLKDFVYVDLLVNYNSDIIDYYYSLDLIKLLNTYIKEDNIRVKNIIISKISIDLINNYKGRDEYDEEKDYEKLELIENENKKIIIKNINSFKDLNIEYNEDSIFLAGIDNIYIEIIISLIKSKKFKNFEYIYNIIYELNLDKINLNKKMFMLLNEKLEINEDYVNNYKISEIYDLFNIEKVNFYFIFLKYILKKSIYIYHISFLLLTRKKIIKIINTNLYQLSSLRADKDKIINDRIEYIIKIITDSEYYFNKYVNSYKFVELKEVMNYYENYLFESKKEDINKINKIFSNKKILKYDNYLHYYEIAKKLNDRLPVINYLYKNNDKNMNEKEISECLKYWDIIEKFIENKSYKKLKIDIRKKLINYFNNKDNKNILLNIFKEDVYQSFIKENIKFLEKDNEEKIITEEKKEKINRSEKTNNIKSTSNSGLIINVTESINLKKSDTSIIVQSSYIQNENISKEKNTIKNDKKQDLNFFNLSIIKEIEGDVFYILEKSSLYKVLEYLKTIRKYKFPIIKKLSNGYYIIGGQEKQLLLYDYLYNFIMEIKIHAFSYDIEEIYCNKKEIKIIICSLDNLFIVIIHLDKNNPKYKETKFSSSDLIAETVIRLDEESFIFSGNKGSYLFNNLLNPQNYQIEPEKILENSYKNGIIVNENIIAFTSNGIYPNGVDNLVFYNLKTNSIIKEIKGYSFFANKNGLCLMNNEKLKLNEKILLCACTKYNSKQKNGILFVKINFKNDDLHFYYDFYETNNFEVNCFCPILIVNNENLINEDISLKKNIKINRTDYFFVGGFEENICQGLIKLFKIINIENVNEIKIKYIQDIVIKINSEFEGFEGTINSMTQSDISGNILISCWDGNIHLMKSPNINYYLQSKK